jgi:hypothetical protein
LCRSDRACAIGAVAACLHNALGRPRNAIRRFWLPD